MPIWNYTRCTGITGSHRVRLRLHFCLTCLTRDTERNAGTRYRDKSGQPYLLIFFFFFFTEVPWATTERTYQISTFNFFLGVISITFFEPSCSLFISYFLLFSFCFLNLYFLFFLSFLSFLSSLYFLSLLLLSASVLSSLLFHRLPPSIYFFFHQTQNLQKA